MRCCWAAIISEELRDAVVFVTSYWTAIIFEELRDAVFFCDELLDAAFFDEWTRCYSGGGAGRDLFCRIAVFLGELLDAVIFLTSCWTRSFF